MSKDFPGVSIIVIGHNEEKNLVKSFKAIKELDYPQNKIEIIFVNSKSTDNSVMIAERYADMVLSTTNFWPTAGEAFNLGIKSAKYDYVHITAGDIILDKLYLKQAIHNLHKSREIACVTGFFIEQNMSKWNKLISYRREEDTNKNPGFTDTPNGGTFKKKILIELNGYDERIKKGQETELGLRIRNNGYKIWDLKIPQGIHDFDVTTFKDLLNRYIVNGKSAAHLTILSYVENNCFLDSSRKNSIRIFSFNLVLLLVILASSIRFSMKGFLISILICTIIIPIKVILRQSGRSINYTKYSIFSGYMSFVFSLGYASFLINVIFDKKIQRYAIYFPKNGLTDGKK